MKKFLQLVKELPSKKVVFAFGRYQPPTVGHGLLVAAVKHVAEKQGADHVIYASRTQDKKSNPLPVERKVYFLKRMFPGTNFVAANDRQRTFIEAIVELNKKYKNLVMVAGSDRVAEYKKILDKYNGTTFHFDTIEVVSAGERDPDSDNASGMSGTKMREAAKKNDFSSFKRGLPSTLTTVDAKRLMNEIREGLGLEPIKESIDLPKSDVRERYHAGEIFNLDEIVESAGAVYQIKKRGSNHLLLQDQSGNLINKWITDVTESTKEFTLLKGLNEMKFTAADKIKVARIIASSLGITDVEKSSNAEQLINNALRKVRSKPMRPEYIEVLHKMLGTAKEAGIVYDEKLVPQKVQVDEGKTGYSPGWMLRQDPALAKKVKDSKKGYQDLKKWAGKELPKKEVAEGTKQPNGTDKVGDASAVLSELSPDTLKSYIPKAMGSKSATDFMRGVKMASGVGKSADELRNKSEKRSTGIHTAIKKLTKEDLEEAAYWKNKSWQKKMADAAKKERQAREKKETEQVKEDLEEAIKLNSKVKIHAPGKDYHDQVGHVGEIRHGAYKGAPKTYTVDYGNNKSVQLDKKNVKLHKEEVELAESKMGELHSTIAKHLDKHISDFKSGHTGMDQFGSKVVAAHKAVAKEHGLEHKHAVKHVNDYVDSKLNEELQECTAAHQKDMDNKKPVYAQGVKGMKSTPFTKKFKTMDHYNKWADSEHAGNHEVHRVYQEEVELEEGKDYSVTVTHYADGKHTDHEYTVTNANDRKHAKHIAMQKHGKKIGGLKQGEQYSSSNTQVKELNKEEAEIISELIEQIATAAMLNKDTTELKKKLALARGDVKNNESDQEADCQCEPIEKKVGQSLTAPHENDTVRKMKVRYQTEEVELEEDQATAEYKVKTYFDNATGTTKTRKVRPHIVSFKNSKKNGEPDNEDPGEDEVKEDVNEGIEGVPAGDSGATPTGAPDAFAPSLVEDDEEIDDKELDKIVNDLDDDDILDAYDEDELIIVDDETGEEIKDDVNEEALMEVLSRAERMRAKIRFAKSKSKRERKIKIALRSRSSTTTINSRARKLAVKLMKQRIAKKPLDKLSVSEKERIEKIVQRRKAVINRLAMKLVPRVKRVESQRLSVRKTK